MKLTALKSGQQLNPSRALESNIKRAAHRGDHRELAFRGGPDGTPMSPSLLPPTVREFEVARR